MVNPLPTCQWVLDRWNSAGPLQRVIYLLVIIALIVLAVGIPLTQSLPIELFARLPPTAPALLFMFFLIAWVTFLFWGWERSKRVEELKSELTRLREQVLANETEEARRLQEAKNLWSRPCEVGVPGLPAVSMRSPRKTRFVTMLNFKGGVGKTTLTANLAAGLALGERPLRVLVIDLDPQGTLGQITVDPVRIDAQARHQAFITRLLSPDPLSDDALRALLTPMNGAPGVDVILANDSLTPLEAELQARFLLDPVRHEPRYRFRAHLHREMVYGNYDVVVFDCPPRITVSVVNALACSDHVLIPTFLDRGSILGVTRMYEWMKSLGGHCPADLLGVVASRVRLWRGRPTHIHSVALDRIREVVSSQIGQNLMFQSIVRDWAEAGHQPIGRVASLTPKGREVLSEVVAEFRERLRL